MRITFLSLLFAAIYYPGVAQDNSSPSQKASKALSGAFKAQNPKEGLKILNEVSGLIDFVDDSIRLDFLIAKGVAHGQLGNSDSSFHYLDEAEQLCKQRSDSLLLIKVYNTKGLVLMGLSQYEEALIAFQKGLAVGEKKSGRYLEATRKLLGNSGGVFYDLGDYESALRHSQRALDISNQLNDSSGIAYNHLRIAISYQALNNLDKCLSHLNQSNDILTNLNDTTTLLYVKNTLGLVYEKVKDFKKALSSYTAANRLATAIANMEEVIHTSLSIGHTHLQMNNLDAAEIIGVHTISATKDNGMANHRKSGYDLLYQVALKRGQFEKALGFRNNYFDLQDSISSADVKARIAELETKYETEKKEAEIEKLSLENELKTANLASSRNANIAMAIGGSLTITLLIVYFTLRHKKQKVEKEAQELQMEALKKRFMELHTSPAELAVALEFNELNEKLNTKLTEREFEALRLSLEGKTNTDIADKLFISVSTVKFHLRNTYAKMGVGNRKEAFQLMLKTS